jgi:hypothetical protein
MGCLEAFIIDQELDETLFGPCLYAPHPVSGAPAAEMIPGDMKSLSTQPIPEEIENTVSLFGPDQRPKRLWIRGIVKTYKGCEQIDSFY